VNQGKVVRPSQLIASVGLTREEWMRRMRARVIVLTIAAVALLSTGARAQVTIVPDTSRTIHVTGRSTVSASPDTATVELGVFADDPSPKKAKAVVDEVIRKIVVVARDLGVADTSVRTAAVNVEPRYADEQQTKFLGYEATRTITVVLRDISKLDDLLDGAVAAGANRNFDVQLTSSKQEQLRQEALEAAVDAAKAQAQAIVQKLGARLGPVRTINLEKAPATVLYSAARVAANSARFLPGDLKIDAEVSLTFILEDEPVGR
jgi:uncharacterized protein YggE